MSDRIRVTGDNPPIDLIDKYPNWENCWDEEGEDDQDETTLRPSSNQSVIHEEVTFAAGDVTYANGQSHPAILAGFEGEIEDVWVYAFENKSQCWGLAGEIGDEEWAVYKSGDLIQPAPADTDGLLPISVCSRLPLETTKQPIRFAITRIGPEC